MRPWPDLKSERGVWPAFGQMGNILGTGGMPRANAGFAAFLVKFQIIGHSPAMWQIAQNDSIGRVLKQEVFHFELQAG